MNLWGELGPTTEKIQFLYSSVKEGRGGSFSFGDVVEVVASWEGGLLVY